MNTRLILASICVLASLSASAEPRRPITDRTWPTDPAQPQVCLWRDDKLAACTITIDDNHPEDHAFWLAQGDATGWRWTWFVIAGKVGTATNWGTWDDFRQLHAAGHDIQSHSVQHLGYGKAAPLTIEQEYADSRAIIEREIPGSRCLTLAYPNGYQPPNDSAVAARFYLACRGVKGVPNPADQTDYRNVNSVSGAAGFLEPAKHWASFEGMLDPAHRGKFRAWYSAHFHGLTDELKAHIAAVLARLKEHEDDTWVGLFREVAQYAQERDTATVTVEVSEPNRLRFVLTDRMDDTSFDQPLTVKVRLPAGWTGAVAQQNGQPAKLTMVRHEDAAFALVHAVPDRGPVELSPASLEEKIP